MPTPLPGQIRCPTCHRSTAPAAFCTQCGSPIPASARARPRGLDREELQDRIRTHRPGDAAFRRGSPVGEGLEQGPSAYRPYQPEPEDDLILPGSDADEAGASHIDNTPAGFDEAPPAPEVEPAPPPPPVIAPPVAPVVAKKPARREPQPAPWKPAPAAVPPPPPTPQPPIEEVEAPPPEWSAAEESYDDGGGYDRRYRGPQDEWDRRGPGVSPLAIGGFVLLGVLAIAVGAFVSGVFSGGVAVASPTPTPLASTGPSDSSQPSLEPDPSVGASVPGSLNPIVTPVPVPDGFTARTEPCADEPSSKDGCGSSGAIVSGGSVWAWVGFHAGNGTDVLGVNVVNASGASEGHGSKALASLGCQDVCSGWLRFRFSGLDPGTYTIRVDRNGLTVAEAPFTVTS